jgi:SNF2 family DNA or RNA helicase
LKKAVCPRETIGGVIADDMGLGKTLTMISTIIRTSEQARFFAEGQEIDGFPGPTNADNVSRLLSRSTLVITPSPCR